MELREARKIAERLAAALSPCCERMEIAGSIRRGKPEVGDIELVAIPRMGADLFGHPSNEGTPLDWVLAEMCDDDGMTLLKGGKRYRQYALAERINLDLFMVLLPAQWGVIYTIRTGPADFSHWIVTPRKQGGPMPSFCKVKDGAVYNNGRLVPMPEEMDLFEFLGLAWIEPGKRRPMWR